MINEKVVKRLDIIKNIFLFILIFTLFLLPALKQISSISSFVVTNHYAFLKIIGIIGLVFLILSLYISFEKSENKKEYVKSILPIFLLTLYMLWTLISAFNAEDKSIAFKGTLYRKEGYFTYIAYAGIFGLAFCISSKKVKKSLLYVFLISSIFVTITYLLAKHEYFKQIFINIGYNSASFSNSNHYGYYLLIATSISAFLFVTEKNKFLKMLNLLVYVYILYNLILNDTFGCYLALAVALLIFLFIEIIVKEKKLDTFILILLFILISLIPNLKTKNITSKNIQTFSNDIKSVTIHTSDVSYKRAGSGRMELWINGFNFFLEKPLLGYGPENLESKYLEVNINMDRPHNLLIQLATTSGLPGLILYISSILIILWKSFKIFDTDNVIHAVCMFSVVAYLVSSMFGNSMYYTSPYFFVLLGFLFRELLNINKQVI